MPIPLIAFAVGGVAYLLGRNHNQRDMALTRSLVLQLLALVASLQATNADDRTKLAEANKTIDQFKQDHDLVNDPEIVNAMEAVLRAAETAPVSADATRAQEVTKDFLDANGDGIDDREQQPAGNVDTANSQQSQPSETNAAESSTGSEGNGEQSQSEESARGGQDSSEEKE